MSQVADLEEYVEVPTVFPAANFDPVGDAHALRSAMKGWGTDEQAIIDILCKRSNSQRQAISATYTKEFGRDLIEDLKSELGGNFESVIVGLMLPTAEYCAKLLYKAMKGAGTDEHILVEILCSRSNEEIKSIAAAYERVYGSSLEEDIKSETSGPLGRLLNMAVNCVRDEHTLDLEKAREQAERLYNAGEGKLGTDEDTFVDILGHGSQRQLYLVFEEYKKISGHTIEQAMEEEMSGDLLSGLSAIVKSVHNRPRFFADRLHAAMEGAGTDESALIRIIVSRCEIDLANIKYEFERDYGKTLSSALKDETTGDFKRALLALVGDP